MLGKEIKTQLHELDILIYNQTIINEKATKIKGFTDHDFADLNKALMVLERLKNNISKED